MGVLSKGTDFTNGDQVTDTTLDNLVDNATFTTSAVDEVSTDIGGTGAIIVKDEGITTGKLANSTGAGDGVTTAKLATAAVTAAKLGTDAVTTAKILDANVTTAKILDANVTTAKIADANVTFAKLADVIDDDTMATATATNLATSESIKAYVDSITYTPNIVQAIKTDTFTQASPTNAWFDIPDLSLSITPTSSSSKVLISADVLSTSSNTTFPTRFRFVRDGVAIALADVDGTTQQCSFTGSFGSAYTPCSGGMSYLDSTAVVAGTPVVYKVQCSNIGSNAIYINRGTASNTTDSYGRTISTLIATEIPQ